MHSIMAHKSRRRSHRGLFACEAQRHETTDDAVGASMRVVIKVKIRWEATCCPFGVEVTCCPFWMQAWVTWHHP